MNDYYLLYSQLFGQSEQVQHYINWIQSMHKKFRKEKGYPEFYCTSKHYTKEFTQWLRVHTCKHEHAFDNYDQHNYFLFRWCPDCETEVKKIT